MRYALLLAAVRFAAALELDQYDLLLKGGHVIDARNGISTPAICYNPAPLNFARPWNMLSTINRELPDRAEDLLGVMG